MNLARAQHLQATQELRPRHPISRLLLFRLGRRETTSGGGTWYRSSSTGRTTLEAEPALPLVAVARTSPPPASDDALVPRRPLPFSPSVLLVVFFELRIRSEELLLSESFPGAYEDYRRRVPQLIPGLRLLRSRG